MFCDIRQFFLRHRHLRLLLHVLVDMAGVPFLQWFLFTNFFENYCHAHLMIQMTMKEYVHFPFFSY